MVAVILKNLFKCMLNLSVIFGLVFMVGCTAFVIICVIHGDIRIKITKNDTEEENK